MAAFLCKASPVPQPYRTAVRVEREEWVLGTSKSSAEEEEQNQLFARRSLLLWHQVRGGILRLSSFHVGRQMEWRKGKQTPCSVAQLGVSAASQAPAPLAAFKQWHWFIEEPEGPGMRVQRGQRNEEMCTGEGWERASVPAEEKRRLKAGHV